MDCVLFQYDTQFANYGELPQTKSVVLDCPDHPQILRLLLRHEDPEYQYTHAISLSLGPTEAQGMLCALDRYLEQYQQFDPPVATNTPATTEQLLSELHFDGASAQAVYQHEHEEFYHHAKELGLPCLPPAKDIDPFAF